MRPTPVRIDGLDLVVWKVPLPEGSKEGAEGWRVFGDACPHRLAPLSEGRIEPKTGCLQCAYHGWEFDSKGCNTRIPQVTEEAGERMRANPRSSATAYPTEVAFCVIWAWLGEGEPVGHPEDLIKGTYLSDQEFFSTYTRDLPYGYDTLMENLLDVSHIPFAHHGLQGTRDDAAPVSMDLPQVRKEFPSEGESHAHGDIIDFHFEDRTMGMERSSDFHLRSPFFFYYLGMFSAPEGKTEEFKKFAARRGYSMDEGVPFRLNVICVPVAPGVSRVMILGAKNPGSDEPLARFPMWVSHVFSNRFLDSDLAFLHYQERKLRLVDPGPDNWQSAYHTPAEADRSISAWRDWLTREGARCVVAGPGSILPPPPERRDRLLDRYTQHTQSCGACQQALANIDLAQRVVGGAGLGALALDRLALGPTPLWLAAEVLAVVAVFGMEKLKEQFHFVDYEHYKS